MTSQYVLETLGGLNTKASNGTFATERTAVPRTGVEPTHDTDGAIGPLFIHTNAQGNVSIGFVRITVGTDTATLDAATVQARLSSGQPDVVHMSHADTSISISVDADGDDGEITKVYVAVFGLNAIPEGASQDETAGVIIGSTVQWNNDGTLTTVGEIFHVEVSAAQMVSTTSDGYVTLDFDSTDKVRDITVSLAVGNVATGATEAAEGMLQVVGRSYA